MLVLSLFLFIIFLHINNILKSFPGIGIDIFHQTINQPFLFTIALIIFIIIIAVCSSILFKEIKQIEGFKSKLTVVISILIQLTTLIAATSNPYFLFYHGILLAVIIITGGSAGYLIAKRFK